MTYLLKVYGSPTEEVELLTTKEILGLFNCDYPFIKTRIAKAYIRLALKFFHSVGEVISYERLSVYFQAALYSNSITTHYSSYSSYSSYMKEVDPNYYNLFLKYKIKFERLDKKLFKGGDKRK